MATASVQSQNKVSGWMLKLAEDPELKRQQERLCKENEWRINNSQDDSLINYAEMEVELAKVNLTLFNNPDVIEAERRRLIDNLITLGRFDEALSLNPDEDLKELAKQLKEAVNRGDNEKCSCEDLEIEVKGKKRIVSRFHELRRVLSQNHDRVIPVMRCGSCGFLNATPNING
jgi:hypothetical protein